MSCISYVLIVLASMVITVTCQTFQYSRGWTNGKRDNSQLGVGSPLLFKVNNLVRDDSSDIVRCDFHNFKIILPKDGDEQFFYLPCEKLKTPPKEIKEGKTSYRHAVYDNNNDNIDN